MTFDAPADLSVGRVTIEGVDGVLKEWVATTNTKGFSLENVQPGFYQAEVAPAGLRPRSYVFEVKPLVANTVTMPLYSILAAGGADAAFSGVDNVRAAVESLDRGRSPTSGLNRAQTNLVPDSAWTLSERQGSAQTPIRILSVGLSQDDAMDELGGWSPYTDGKPAVELEAGELKVLIASSPDALKRRPRLRLSTALQDVRTERLMVPVFLGGTRVSFRASPFSAADVAIEVTPLDPERRALMRALQAGVEEEAVAVFQDVLNGGSIARFVDGVEEDAWAAMVAALLTMRFPDFFGPKSPEWGPYLADRYPWASDVHIILARHHLTAASVRGQRDAAAVAALDALRRAQRLGAPYFAAANAFMGEMLSGLAGLKDLSKSTRNRAFKQLGAWRSDAPLQRSAGAVFSWVSADRAKREQGESAPYRGSGNLAPKYASILFRGQVGPSGISILTPSAEASAPKASQSQSSRSISTAAKKMDASGVSLASSFSPPNSPEAPALSRPILVDDDANKGRFGGKAETNGHKLSASFSEPVASSGVDVHIVVRAGQGVASSYSDVVELFLHPTFSPSRLKIPFRGAEASITVRALGGFTVGAWLPTRGVELECDLAELAGAPRIIREL